MNRPRKLRVNLLSGNAAALVLLGGCFLIGSVAGCMTVRLLKAEDCGALIDVLDACTDAVKRGDESGAFLPIFWQMVRVPLLAFLLGLTALGLVGMPVLFTVRGFCLCYAVSVLYRLQGGDGLVLGLCLFGTSALLWLPGLFGLGAVGFTGSYGLMRRVFGDGRYPLRTSAGLYWITCGLCILAVLCAAMVEYLLVPVLVRLTVV